MIYDMLKSEANYYGWLCSCAYDRGKGGKRCSRTLNREYSVTHFKIDRRIRRTCFLAFQDDNVLIRQDKDKLWYPSFADFSLSHPQLRQKARFLFAIDDLNYYLVEAEGLEAEPGWVYVSNKRFRSNNWRSFIGIIGWQLHSWYNNHKFCSRCREPLQHSEIERLLYCASCGMSVYPTIAPCVIVGVYDKDRLLMTKYANREYRKYALIAGFNEIGESLEQTVCREVLEEVGLRVKNIRYYKSQPWPFSDTSLLAGFFAKWMVGTPSTWIEDEFWQWDLVVPGKIFPNGMRAFP